MTCGDSDAHGDDAKQDQLPAAVQAERAAMCELDEVVEEADRSAGQRYEEHRQRGHRVAAEREEAGRRRQQDEQAPHRRRALLGDVVLRPFLADVLAVLLAPQVGHELRADEDRDQQGDDACQEDAAQALTAASVSATRSRPTARDAFTSTQSPGSTRSDAHACLLYTSDAADERSSVDLG